MKDLPLGRTAALVPEVAVKIFPWAEHSDDDDDDDDDDVYGFPHWQRSFHPYVLMIISLFKYNP